MVQIQRVLVLVVGLCAASVGLASCDRKSLPPNSPAQVADDRPIASPTLVFTGRVIAITDGDTIKVLVNGREQRTVRFAEIDAPEKSQPWGNRSRQALSALVYGRNVEVRQADTDRYGRTVAHVLVDGRDINREMVASGAAWAFRRYLVDQSLIGVEAAARQQRLGLWSMPPNEIVAPWEWRRGVRAVSPGGGNNAVPAPPRALLSTPGASRAEGFICGAKTRCSQMSSCAEARAYLTECQVSSLDGNSDGEPCEQLCGTGGL